MLRKVFGFTIAAVLCTAPQFAGSQRSQPDLPENELADLNAMPPDANAIDDSDDPIQPLDNTAAADVEDDVSAAANEAMAAAEAAAAAFRFYRTSVAGTGSGTRVIYVDAYSIRDLGGFRRGWETAYLAQPAAGWPTGAHHVVSLIEADCAQERTRTITVAIYSRGGAALQTAQPPFPQWVYVIPDTVGWQTMRFICGTVPRSQFVGVQSPEADARLLLPRPQPSITVPRNLRPRRN